MNDPYRQLKEHFATIADIDGASAILGWDKSAIMPEGGGDARAQQLATLSSVAHGMLTASEVADLLSKVEADGRDIAAGTWDSANVREMRRAYELATALPADFVRALSYAESRCEMTWRRARADDDFSLLVPSLEELLSLVREKADALAAVTGLSPYDALLDTYDPGRRSEMVDAVFDDLAEHLPPLLDRVIEHQAGQPDVIVPEGPFPADLQKALAREVMAQLGFDFRRGRLDESLHPFTGGVPDDSRLTTRYTENDFTSSLMGVIHETGHALYEQGLPKDWRRQPVGASWGMTVHESQSLLFEMQVGRSRPFIAWLTPRLLQTFGGSGPAFALDNLIRLYHRVGRSLIRVDADEVSYPLHVILRYRLERAMLAGDLAVADLPAAWNDGMVALVGIRPETDREGCLQDIHWPSGAFGYFPTYTLGALAAAQLFEAARQRMPNIDDDLANGRFGPLLGWLREAIHARGRRDEAGTVIAAATGKPLGAEALKAHLERRYLDDR